MYNIRGLKKFSIILFFIPTFFTGCNFSEKILKTSVSNAPANIVQANITEISYYSDFGETALESIEKRAQVESRQLSSSTEITTINQTKNTATLKWRLYINNLAAENPPDQILINRGDLIEWRYE